MKVNAYVVPGITGSAVWNLSIKVWPGAIERTHLEGAHAASANGKGPVLYSPGAGRAAGLNAKNSKLVLLTAVPAVTFPTKTTLITAVFEPELPMKISPAHSPATP